jgi:alginate O-acetyltransferase complex protein AlgI
MIFTTYWFLIFAGLVVPVYWLCPWARARLWFLAAACALFHAHFAGPAGVIPILILMAITYGAGLTRDRRWCLAAIVACVLALCFYKYFLFLVGATLQPWQPALAAKVAAQVKGALPAAPPLGLSFFVFEFVHYLIEVRRGGEPIRSPLKFGLFAIFFPSLVAGPIKRYPQFLASLEEGAQRFSLDNLAEGLRRIGLGYAKKVLLADNLTHFIDVYHPQFAALDLAQRWLFVAALAFRILLDFSGYSDIAIGFARLVGVRLPENFNWPYLAANLQDFWQRWHISLSSWIRDYIYIPLGGSRHGTPRRLLNGLLAFGLCGLWHGAAWNFVAWGVYHGAGLGLCATYRSLPGVGPVVSRLFGKEPLAALVLTQLYAWLGWLLFFYPVPEAWRMFKLLFGA